MRASDVRHLAALAHAAEGVTLDLVSVDGTTSRVGYGCLDAAATPCQLRRWAGGIAPEELRRFAGRLATIEVRGLVELGGGLYERAGDVAERWFTTTLVAAAVVDLLDHHPEAGGDLGVSVRLLPDPWLGITVACVTAPHPAATRFLDEGATWALGACLTGELLSSLPVGELGSGDIG